jgi:hypothetical protein
MLVHNLSPQVRHTQFPANHALQVCVELLSLPDTDYVIYGLLHQIGLLTLLLVLLLLLFKFLLMLFELGLTVEEVGQCATYFGGHVRQV